MEGVEIVIGFAKSKNNLTAQQRSLLQLAFWALTMAKEPDPIDQPDEYEEARGDRFRAQHLLYIFIMDLGVSPFVKCYDDVALLTGLVRSGEFTILRDLLKHKYITIYYEDFAFLKRQIKRATDRWGNNILHEIYKMPETARNIYLDILNEYPMEVHFRPSVPLPWDIQARFERQN